MPTTQTVRSALARDHEELLDLLARLLRNVTAGDSHDTEAALTAFARRLRTHFRVEEEVLFAALERCGTIPPGAIHALTREHGALCRLLAEAERGPATGLAANLRELDAALKLHQRREDELVYPIIDRLLGASTILDFAALLTERT